jgi:predicted  nucleic acid-binding Zn-ribbon protein
MELKNLTISEIQLKISKLTERSETLSSAVGDISDDNARTDLQKQVNRYRNLLHNLNKELSERRGQTYTH